MEYVWILGHGPVLIDKQFLLDVTRLKNITLNSIPLPSNKYAATYLLFLTGRQYYAYSRYANQTMGNMIMKKVQESFHPLPVAPVVQERSVFINIDSKKQSITCSLRCHVYTMNLALHSIVQCYSVVELHHDPYIETIILKPLFYF